MAMVQKMVGKIEEMFSNSRLVVGQIKGELEARDTRMQEYLSKARCIQTKFEFFDLSYIPRNGNTHTDSLATLATSSTQDLPRVILVEDLCTPTPIKRDFLQVHQIKLGPRWMDTLLLFLERDVLPKKKLEAEKVQRKTPQFWMSEDKKL